MKKFFSKGLTGSLSFRPPEPVLWQITERLNKHERREFNRHTGDFEK